MILTPIKIAKRIGTLCTILLVLSTLTSCFKDFTEDFLFTEKMIEIDAATWESKAPGKTYPIKGPYEKGIGTQTFQVNLIGGLMATDQTVSYRIVPEETTAVEGVHYNRPNNGNFVIPANSTTGYLPLEILDFPAESGTHTLVVELIGNDQIKVSENYKRLGVSILLTGPPSEGYPLHEQLGPDSYFNSIYFDPLNPYIPADIRQRIQQSAANLLAQAPGTGNEPRRLQNMYIYFGNDNLVTVVAQYYGGGGGSLTSGPIATWTYEMVLDAQGIGRLEFKEANGNGNSQRTNFFPILGDYLEKYEFKVDWVDPGIMTPARPEVQLGGLFRTDDPASYILGPLATLNATGTIRPFPSSPVMHELFTDGNGGYYTTLYIDPASTTQSPAFQTRWQEAYDHIVTTSSGRKLHKMMFYFNPTFNFQDVRIINYYYNATDAKFIGQMRFQWRVDYDGHVKPFTFIYQDANGNVTRAPQLIDTFLMTTEFAMTRTGDRIRFTSVDDPSVYFEGELSNHPLNVNTFWPE